jgi:ATP-dependent DNA helicase Q5
VSFLLKQELAKAKSEHKREKAKAAIESFKTMLKYCETATSCRHAVFSAFFGDEPPECKNQCDICKEPKKAEKKAQAFQNQALEAAAYRTTALTITNGYDADLYEGGRGGHKRSFADHGEAPLACFG